MPKTVEPKRSGDKSIVSLTVMRQPLQQPGK